ncbi:hypothetical protein PF005_g22792 [Phytophthora fragariae]|uniref:Uncharacterized protein n=2 Tax=Phytophthora TaxID=4783 RepID=A0A6A3S0F2_9STRA|nr:hypothetical protein PF003_g14087 [Phytophthora fragariae]KAE9029876.1 hypothetical protein PR002_g10019 [Phytophthora rubi]KAE8926224.1 hypothetical protein PF009_g23581 [Phytophthora fragariae]KAE8982700.1 hypothetical protein PF011_g21506 [Phytophthora fragariae]KAE9080822.1 hypothetical protein PF010_g22238 [Phytophthora fragariae]
MARAKAATSSACKRLHILLESFSAWSAAAAAQTPRRRAIRSRARARVAACRLKVATKCRIQSTIACFNIS